MGSCLIRPSSHPFNAGGKGFGAPDVFDNAYYTALLRRPWLDTKDGMASMIGLPSDHVLPDDKECLPFIQVGSGKRWGIHNLKIVFIYLCDIDQLVHTSHHCSSGIFC